MPLLVGLAAHASYMPLLRYFPWIPLASLESVLAAGALLGVLRAESHSRNPFPWDPPATLQSLSWNI